MPALHFLLVGDDCDTRFLLRHALQRRYPGAIVTECWNAPDAEAALGRQAFDLIIAHRAVNVGVPEMVRRLRVSAPHRPVLAVSGNVSDQLPAGRAGATAFLDLARWTFIADAVAPLLSAPTRAAA